MAAARCVSKFARGMMLAFKREASEELAGIGARVIDVWPRLRSGEYLVTLEYEAPVRVGSARIRQIEAFASELYQLEESAGWRRAAASSSAPARSPWWLSMLQYGKWSRR